MLDVDVMYCCCAVSDRHHEKVVTGLRGSFEDHFTKLACGGGSGMDPEKWGDKWKKDIEKGIRGMKDRLERLNSGKDKQKWGEIIEEIEERLGDTP